MNSSRKPGSVEKEKDRARTEGDTGRKENLILKMYLFFEVTEMFGRLRVEGTKEERGLS